MCPSLHSMVESGMASAPKDDLVFKAADPAAPKASFASLADQLQKMGARHGKKDKASVQAIHDSAATLAEGVHCCEMAEKAIKPEALAKANARHSAKDLERVKKIHGMSVELGAECDGTSKMDAADPEEDEDDGKGGKD